MRLLHILPLTGLLLLQGCSPTFNWRELRIPDTALTAMLPCKPDAVTRAVEMGPVKVDLHMQGCDAGNATFAVATAPMPPNAPPANQMLAQWRAANLLAMQAAAPQLSEQSLPGLAGPTPQKVIAKGVTGQGKPVESHALYFQQGNRLFYAVILAERVTPDMSESFFAGLRLQ
jgi:hypothetical protein